MSQRYLWSDNESRRAAAEKMFSMLSEGVETHQVEGVPVRITSIAKTLADCFKYRNKIGLDVALEALREAWRERKVTMDEIDRFARVCRVARVMRPNLEALAA